MSRIYGAFSDCERARTDAAELAARFGVPHVSAEACAVSKLKHREAFIRDHVAATEGESSYVFWVSEGPLQLLQLSSQRMLGLSADLADPALNYRRLRGGGKQQMLARAIGIGSTPKLRVLDATAGLGRDAFILASLGASVTMLERAPEVYALLEYALGHARRESAAQAFGFGETLDRMSLQAQDAFDYLTGLTPENRPDVIYLDPMFPQRQKSALVKKEMRILHDLVGADLDSRALFEIARRTGVPRIVVKRPRIAPALSPDKPSHSFSGKRNRFDIYRQS